jgi:hypothetical protein
MIREAKDIDLTALISMGRDYHAESPFGDLIAFDTATWARTLVGLLESPDGIVLLSGHGFIAGFIGPCWFNEDARIAHEIGWRDSGGDGIALLQAFEAWAFDRGARYSLGLNMPGNRDDALDRLYRRLGYRSAGCQFIKELP